MFFKLRVIYFLLDFTIYSLALFEEFDESFKYNDINCGLSKSSLFGDRIYGGRHALKGEFPWFVSLECLIGSEWIPCCGATIINERTLITAAHCLSDETTRTVRAKMGSNKAKESTAHQQYYYASKFILHENFVERTYLNDIALIIVSKPIEFNRSNGYINTICLHETSMSRGMVTVTGFGRTEKNSRSSDLLTVDIPIISVEKCKKNYNSFEINVVDGMMCAGTKGKDSCVGDSGGPVISRDRDGRASLVGVVSWADGCASSNKPGVNSDISHYFYWIISKLD